MKHQFERLQTKAVKEIKDDSISAHPQTKAWAAFTKMKGNLDIPLFNMRDKDIDMLLNHLNSKQEHQITIRDRLYPSSAYTIHA